MGDLRTRVPGPALLDRALEVPADEFAASSEDTLSWLDSALLNIAVAEVLSQLSAEWTVLHAVPAGRHGDINHLVIGPTGVYSIGTLNDSGGSTDRADQAAARASLASSLLSETAGLAVPVVPVVVRGAAGRTGGAQLRHGVRLLSVHDLLDELRSRRVYSDGQVHRIVAAAARPATWRQAA